MEIIIKYWSQITVVIGIVIGGIGFILKILLNWNLRKKEITFSKLKETKIIELKNFYSSYINLEVELKNLLRATAQNKEEDIQTIQQRMPEIWKQFYFDSTFIRLYLSTDELEIFEELKKELDNIQLKIDFYRIDQKFGEYDNDLIKELRHIRDEIFPVRIPALLKQIEKNFKNDFNIK